MTKTNTSTQYAARIRALKTQMKALRAAVRLASKTADHLGAEPPQPAGTRVTFYATSDFLQVIAATESLYPAARGSHDNKSKSIRMALERANQYMSESTPLHEEISLMEMELIAVKLQLAAVRAALHVTDDFSFGRDAPPYKKAS